MDIPVLAGGIATAVFAFSTLPMLIKAWRTKDVRSYSPGNITLANVGNLIYLVYVLHLPVGPALVLHLFHTAASALMLYWYLRYAVLAKERSADRMPLDAALSSAIATRGAAATVGATSA
ncbi:PQ-loop repeat-containing protein [Streptomyces sp. SID6673]|nr:PQ-loop repeat-containing protein [Streptomyces sp. SID11726]NEB26374.1 PQ-loop repeat-containing protein [Streptomyces sp. SID6673]NED59544.1 PQ-loop repeat-containing protein [Streptomyces sp. SID10244]